MDDIDLFAAQLDRTLQRALRARAAVEEMTDVAAAAAARGAAIPPAPAMSALGLSAAQLDFVWTAVACSVDGRVVPHLEALGGAHARRGLSAATYALLAEIDDGSVAALAHWLASPNPLVELELLAPTEPASPAARAYVASPRLVAYLRGEAHPTGPVRVAHPAAGLLHDPDQRATIATIAGALVRDPDTVVVVEGPRGSGRTTAIACAASADVVVLDCARIAAADLRAGLVALRREALLRGALPVVANADRLPGDDIGHFVDAAAGPLCVTVTVPGADLGTERPLLRLRWEVASTDVRAALWARAAGATAGDLSALAHRYRVGPAAIDRAVASARLLVPAEAPLDDAALARGLRHNIAEQMGGLATRVEVTQSWDDLVIADDTHDQIAALVGRIRHAHQVLEQWGYRRKIARGAGVAALFSGPPGTGKTMVAGLIARELDLELYQVDLSKIVSKWVGETEKQLARVFDAAEEGHALLLFDEADALFGQRSTEMKGAVDRYANLEVNYLLQRVEAFGGITVLTTNLESAIDAALKRRLASHIVFAAPDEDERARLWERQIQTGDAPIDRDVDPEDLARDYPSMTGANIRNAAIAAAFLAAGDGAPRIGQQHLMRAARAEYRSMGHMVNESIGGRPGGRKR